MCMVFSLSSDSLKKALLGVFEDLSPEPAGYLSCSHVSHIKMVFSINGIPHLWMVYFMENLKITWMITRGTPGTPISGNLQMASFRYLLPFGGSNTEKKSRHQC